MQEDHMLPVLPPTPPPPPPLLYPPPISYPQDQDLDHESSSLESDQEIQYLGAAFAAHFPQDDYPQVDNQLRTPPRQALLNPNQVASDQASSKKRNRSVSFEGIDADENADENIRSICRRLSL